MKFCSIYFAVKGSGLCTVAINPLNSKRRPLYLKTSPYRAVNTFNLGYKNQSVYAVSGTSR